jgi:hypothetical protein
VGTRLWMTALTVPPSPFCAGYLEALMRNPLQYDRLGRTGSVSLGRNFAFGWLTSTLRRIRHFVAELFHYFAGLAYRRSRRCLGYTHISTGMASTAPGWATGDDCGAPLHLCLSSAHLAPSLAGVTFVWLPLCLWTAARWCARLSLGGRAGDQLRRADQQPMSLYHCWPAMCCDLLSTPQRRATRQSVRLAGCADIAPEAGRWRVFCCRHSPSARLRRPVVRWRYA